MPANDGDELTAPSRQLLLTHLQGYNALFFILGVFHAVVKFSQLKSYVAKAKKLFRVQQLHRINLTKVKTVKQ